MTSILVLVETIQCKQFRCIYRKKKNSDFFCAFFKSTLNFEHFQKKMSLIVYVFPKLQTLKNVVRQMSKKSRWTSIIFFIEKIQ